MPSDATRDLSSSRSRERNSLTLLPSSKVSFEGGWYWHVACRPSLMQDLHAGRAASHFCVDLSYNGEESLRRTMYIQSYDAYKDDRSGTNAH